MGCDRFIHTDCRKIDIVLIVEKEPGVIDKQIKVSLKLAKGAGQLGSRYYEKMVFGTRLLTLLLLQLMNETGVLAEEMLYVRVSSLVPPNQQASFYYRLPEKLFTKCLLRTRSCPVGREANFWCKSALMN